MDDRFHPIHDHLDPAWGACLQVLVGGVVETDDFTIFLVGLLLYGLLCIVLDEHLQVVVGRIVEADDLALLGFRSLVALAHLAVPQPHSG